MKKKLKKLMIKIINKIAKNVTFNYRMANFKCLNVVIISAINALVRISSKNLMEMKTIKHFLPLVC